MRNRQFTTIQDGGWSSEKRIPGEGQAMDSRDKFLACHGHQVFWWPRLLFKWSFLINRSKNYQNYYSTKQARSLRILHISPLYDNPKGVNNYNCNLKNKQGCFDILIAYLTLKKYVQKQFSTSIVRININ